MSVRQVDPIKVFRPPPGGTKNVVNDQTNEDPRNEKRRTAYATDADVRETTQARARQRYRRKNGTELGSCLRSLSFYKKLAKSRSVVLPNGTIRTFPVMGIQSTADCLQKIYSTLWRWKDREMIPAPVLITEARRVAVYHVNEVCILIEEIGTHEETMVYYRANHRDVRERIFSRINALRSQWS